MTPHRPPMRLARLAVLLGFATAASPAFAGDEAPSAPAWREDYGAALEEARSSGRLLWIQFTGPWCPGCARMEEDSFPSPAVVAHTKSEFVPLRLRADVHQEMALDFELSGLPASVIVDADRKVLAVHQGYLGADELDGLLGRVAAAHPPRHNAEDLADAPSSRREFVGPPAPRLAAAERPAKREEHAELAGYCPVSLVAEKKLVQGQAEYVVEHGGRVYRFANALTFNLFRRDPERYVPANDGRCPVEQLDAGREAPGDPRFGALYNGRLYLCASKDGRARFLREPERYAAVGVEAGGNCPHCLAERGEAVPGDPRYSLAQGGRRFWFPDEAHRDAFMSLAPSDTIRR